MFCNGHSDPWIKKGFEWMIAADDSKAVILGERRRDKAAVLETSSGKQKDVIAWWTVLRIVSSDGLPTCVAVDEGNLLYLQRRPGLAACLAFEVN